MLLQIVPRVPLRQVIRIVLEIAKPNARRLPKGRFSRFAWHNLLHAFGFDLTHPFYHTDSWKATTGISAPRNNSADWPVAAMPHADDEPQHGFR